MKQTNNNMEETTKNDNNNNNNKWKKFLQQNGLTLFTIVGVVLGCVCGVLLKEFVGKFTQREVMYVNFIGDLFLRMLKGLIIPLIVSSLISAIAGMDVSLSGKIARRAIVYYLTTTVSAVVLGILLVSTIQPGSRVETDNDSSGDTESRNMTTVDTLLDLVRNMFPPNVVQACIEQSRTKLSPPKDNPDETDFYQWNIDGEEIVKGTNILGLVIFSVATGIALAILQEEGHGLKHFFDSLAAVSMKITSWIIMISPVGIFFLVTAKLMEMEDFGQVMEQLGLYFGTVLLGLLVHALIVLPLIYILFTRRSPVQYALNLSQAIVAAFGTASSAATLPITIKLLEEKNNIDSRITRFVLPIGATINMDGTALYEAVAAIFIAQIRGVDLSVGSYVAISITATAASIGAAGIPQAGLVTMVMVLDTVGLPAQDVSLILAIDWLLDRFRTAINVLGDAFGAGIVNHLSKKQLEEIPNQNV